MGGGELPHLHPPSTCHTAAAAATALKISIIGEWEKLFASFPPSPFPRRKALSSASKEPPHGPSPRWQSQRFRKCFPKNRTLSLCAFQSSVRGLGIFQAAPRRGAFFSSLLLSGLPPFRSTLIFEAIARFNSKLVHCRLNYLPPEGNCRC